MKLKKSVLKEMVREEYDKLKELKRLNFTDNKDVYDSLVSDGIDNKVASEIADVVKRLLIAITDLKKGRVNKECKEIMQLAKELPY